jgi:hypothetical protein
MYYSKISQLGNLVAPNQLQADFNISLALSLGLNSPAELNIPKNFTGNKYAVQALNIAEKTTEFNNLANGKEQFPESEHMQLAYLKIEEGVNAQLNKTVWIAGVSDVDILNGKIDIVNNGLTIIRDMPLSEFVRAEEQPYSGQVAFVSPTNLLAQSEFRAVIKVDNVPVANTNLRLTFSGVGYIS